MKTIVTLAVALAGSLALADRPTATTAPLAPPPPPVVEPKPITHLAAIEEVTRLLLQPTPTPERAPDGFAVVRFPRRSPFHPEAVGIVESAVWRAAREEPASLKAAVTAVELSSYGFSRPAALNFTRAQVRAEGMQWTPTTARAFGIAWRLAQ